MRHEPFNHRRTKQHGLTLNQHHVGFARGAGLDHALQSGLHQPGSDPNHGATAIKFVELSRAKKRANVENDPAPRQRLDELAQTEPRSGGLNRIRR
jgi:hypothetical protein